MRAKKHLCSFFPFHSEIWDHVLFRVAWIPPGASGRQQRVTAVCVFMCVCVCVCVCDCVSLKKEGGIFD